MKGKQIAKGSIARKVRRFNSRKMFADWLWKVLQSIHQKRYRSPDVMLIRRYESSIEGIAYVYENYVPMDRRKMFRQAIGDVLRLKGNNEDAPYGAFEDLIYLICRLKATEALDAITPTVSNGLLGEKNPEIFFNAVSLLSTLRPSPEVYRVTCDLRDGVNFDNSYAASVRKILKDCECHTKRFRRK